MSFSGRVWRHVPPDAAALHLGKLLKYSEGRWNRRGEYACLYTALTREGALAELEKLRLRSGSVIGERDLVSIDSRIDPVVDLTDPNTYKALAQRSGQIPNEALLTSDGAAAYDHCHTLADQARLEGYTAMLVPSAALSGGTNLAIYFDVVAPKRIEIDDGPDRVRIPAPLNPGPAPGT
jgi:RES domain-containing protein